MAVVRPKNLTGDAPVFELQTLLMQVDPLYPYGRASIPFPALRPMPAPIKTPVILAYYQID